MGGASDIAKANRNGNVTKTCKWVSCDDSWSESVYNTECKHTFIIMEGTPEENNFKYCPYCGGEIK